MISTNKTKAEKLQTKRLKKNQCIICGKDKGTSEYICDKCFDEQMNEDMESLAKECQQEEEYERDEQYSQDWRFKDSRGRSVFRRDM